MAMSRREHSIDQLTIKGFGDDLGSAVHSLAEREAISLNQAALKLLRRGAGLSDTPRRTGTVDSSFDHLIGHWTPSEADEMDAALEDFEIIDEAARQ